MSQLTGLKSQIQALGEQSAQIAGQLNQFEQSFRQTAGSVQATIAGSSQRKDAEMTAAIQQAQVQVQHAAAAMVQCKRIADAYAASI